jgi:hypothetical protein
MQEDVANEVSERTVYFSCNGFADGSAFQLQRDVAFLDSLRQQLANPATRIVFLLDPCAASSANVGRHVLARNAGTLLHDLAQYGDAGPTFVIRTDAPSVAAGAASTFTSAMASGQAGYPPLADIAAQDFLPCQKPLDNLDQLDFVSPKVSFPATSTIKPVTPFPSSASLIGNLLAFDTAPTVQPSNHDADMAPVVPPAAAAPRIAIAIDLDLLPGMRSDLLRLVYGVRAVICLALARVQAALARGLHTRSFALVLVATSRCYGHRGEPDDHMLPADRSMSVVRGELVLVT